MGEWIFYLLVGAFVLKTIYDLSPPTYQAPRIPDPPPKSRLQSMIEAEQERKFHMTLDKMMQEYPSDIRDPKDVMVFSIEGSGVHLMPMFMTKEAADIFKEKEEADDLDGTFFGADDLLEQLEIDDEDAVVDGTDHIFYEYLHEIDVSTDAGGLTFKRGITTREADRKGFVFDDIKVGALTAETNQWEIDNYEYCLMYVVSCSKGLSNFEYKYTDNILPAPSLQDELSYDAQNIYYNDTKIPIEGFYWEYMDFWNPISYCLVPTKEIKKIKMRDLF